MLVSSNIDFASYVSTVVDDFSDYKFNEMRSFTYLLKFLQHYIIYLCHVENNDAKNQENVSKFKNDGFVLHNFGTFNNPKEEKTGKSLKP